MPHFVRCNGTLVNLDEVLSMVVCGPRITGEFYIEILFKSNATAELIGFETKERAQEQLTRIEQAGAASAASVTHA